MADTTITVTVATGTQYLVGGSGNVYYFDGSQPSSFTFPWVKGATVRLDQSASSNDNHPLIFNIFHIPEADAIILSAHFNSQNKKTSVFVFFKIFVNPVISSPNLEAPINLRSNDIVTHGAFPAVL